MLPSVVNPNGTFFYFWSDDAITNSIREGKRHGYIGTPAVLTAFSGAAVGF